MMAEFSTLRFPFVVSAVVKSLGVTALLLSWLHAGAVVQAQDDKKQHSNGDDKKAGVATELPPKTLSAKELMARADDFNARGDLDRAIADYDAALKIDPIFVEALNSRAMAWRAKGDRRRALTDLDSALRLKPDFEVARANRKVLFHEIELQGAKMPLKPAAAR